MKNPEYQYRPSGVSQCDPILPLPAQSRSAFRLCVRMLVCSLHAICKLHIYIQLSSYQKLKTCDRPSIPLHVSSCWCCWKSRASQVSRQAPPSQP